MESGSDHKSQLLRYYAPLIFNTPVRSRPQKIIEYGIARVEIPAACIIAMLLTQLMS